MENLKGATPPPGRDGQKAKCAWLACAGLSGEEDTL
jgi:hypothetical protein